MKKFTIFSILLILLLIPFFASAKLTNSSRLNKSEVITPMSESIVLVKNYVLMNKNGPKNITKITFRSDYGSYEVCTPESSVGFREGGIITAFEKREVQGMPSSAMVLIAYEPPETNAVIKFLIPEYIFSGWKKEYEDFMKIAKKYDEARKNQNLIKEFRKKYGELIK